MKFKMNEWRQRNAQAFDKDKITITKAGKTYNVYDAIQEAREDTEIYPTLEKYGCLDKVMLNKELTAQDFKDYRELGELRDIKNQQILAQKMFYDLPLETRKHFNNDINIFLKDGEKYVNDLIKADIDKTNKSTTQEATNEQK